MRPLSAAEADIDCQTAARGDQLSAAPPPAQETERAELMVYQGAWMRDGLESQ